MAKRIKHHEGRGKKHRKHGRNKLFCEAYLRDGRREKNKAIKLKKHLIKYPDDRIAISALAKL